MALGRPDEEGDRGPPGRAHPRGPRPVVRADRRARGRPRRGALVRETRHGMLLDALLAAGDALAPVNRDLVARRRALAKKKDDAEDAPSRRSCRRRPLRGAPPAHARWGGDGRSARRSPRTISGRLGTGDGCSTGCSPGAGRRSRRHVITRDPRPSASRRSPCGGTRERSPAPRLPGTSPSSPATAFGTERPLSRRHGGAIGSAPAGRVPASCHDRRQARWSASDRARPALVAHTMPPCGTPG